MSSSVEVAGALVVPLEEMRYTSWPYFACARAAAAHRNPLAFQEDG